jgi:hypothetical protein
VKKRSVFAVVVVLLLMSSVAFSQDNRRTEKFAFPIAVAGQFIGQCNDFQVLTDYTVLITGTDRYDKSGQFVQEILKARLMGESRYYNSTNDAKEVLGGPGEVENDRWNAAQGLVYVTGLIFKVRVPGYGLIFAETGRAVLDLNTGEWGFNSGHNQWVDGDVAALCNYLK